MLWALFLCPYVAFPLPWLKMDRITPGLHGDVFGRKLAYCLPGVRFHPGRGPYPRPDLLAPALQGACVALHLALRGARVPLGGAVAVWGIALAIGLFTFGPSTLPCAEYYDLAPHALTANLAWSAGGSALFMALWVRITHPGWLRAVATAPLVAVAVHMMASTIYIMSLFTSRAFTQAVGG